MITALDAPLEKLDEHDRAFVAQVRDHGWSRTGVALDEEGEGGVYFAFAAGVEDWELHSLGARRFLHFSHHARLRIVWVHE